MAMSPYYVQYLLNQGDLLSRILSFNADFGAKQSSLRAQKDNDAIKDSLYKVHPQLAKFHEDHNISYYFENNVDRLCLLRTHELDTLLVYLGACISSNQLAAITKQEEKDLIYNSIGRETYEFALDYGYLIKNLDFMINIDNLRKDCIYLGLCALKCVEPLFSSKELSEYFIDSLINFAKSIGLDPNIVTSKTHVLSVVYNTADLHQAPTPDVMNNPVQYTPVDNHPKLGKPTALELAIQEFDAKAEQEREQAEIDTMAILAKARASVKAANMAKAFQERADLVAQALAAHRALTAELEYQEKKEQSQTAAQAQAETQSQSPEQQPVIRAKQRTLREPLKKTVVKNVSSGPITPGSDSDDSLSFLMKVQAPDRSEHNAQATADAQSEPSTAPTESKPSQADTNLAPANASAPAEATTTATATAADTATAQATVEADSNQNNNSQAASSQENNNATALPQGENAPDISAATAKEASDSQATEENSTQETNTSAEKLANDYEQAYLEAQARHAQTGPVYGNINDRDSRSFRVASIKQKNALKELSEQVNDPKATKNPANLEEEHLVTLDFNEHQVFNLTYLILYSQINECWYDYLKDEENQ
ncbi:hypothetical protein MXE38_06210 [Anaerobiospirillum sp. NML120448]|uniref:hypothetical protein n=1 Tax=Anaerobiospirillum sp. NML120448 TaxID=2932816 RepID=UPI001FF1CB94|nr:hypothetical protein [Anaerobiospirillum sp. NML120448]MCK0514449.1 hypothetical protein [Anaerobiospirillum sp. NML120448]